MSTRPYKDYKVNELKELLKERELSVSGTKPELIARLEESDEQKQAEAPAEEEAETEAPETNEPETEEATEKPQAETAAPAATEDSADAPAQEAPAKEVVATETVVEVDPVKQIITEIETKIAEEKAAGNPTEELEKRLKRIHRFGAASLVDSHAKAKINHFRHNSRGSQRNNRQKNSAGVSK